MNELYFSKQVKGAALITSLLILLVLSIIGLAFMGSSILAERMAANEQISVITTNAAQAASKSVAGFMEREGLVLNSTSFALARNNAVRDSADPYGATNNTFSVRRCVGEDGTVTGTCDGAVKLDSSTNLRNEASIIYRGCISTNTNGSTAQILNNPGTSTQVGLVPHFVELDGTGWYETSGDVLPTDGTDPLSIVEITYATIKLAC